MAQARLSASQKKKAWDTNLDMASRPADIFAPDFTGVLRDGKSAVLPNSVIAKKKASSGENHMTISLLKDLEGTGRIGGQDLLGYEEAQSTVEMSIYADEVKHAVSGEKYGLNAWEKSPYRILDKANPQLALWHKQYGGANVRQAMCENYSQNLTATGTQVGLTAKVNSNTYVMGVANTSQPAYDSTASTYASNINTAFSSSAEVTLDYLNALSEWVTSIKYLEPIELNGKPKYILTIPSRSKTLLWNVAGSASTLFKEADVRGTNNAAFKLEGFEYGNLMLVEDVKAPRATITAGSTAFSYFGVTDDRATPGATVADVGYILGKSPVIEYEIESLHYEFERQDYDRILGIGALRTRGYNLREYDLVTGAGDTTIVNKSSAIVLFQSV